MDNCKPEIDVEKNIWRCNVCGFEYPTIFNKNCVPKVLPYKCVHTGPELEILDTKHCNCSGRGSYVAINRCEKYGGECGVLTLLNFNKRKELENRGVKDCMGCPSRFDKE